MPRFVVELQPSYTEKDQNLRPKVMKRKSNVEKIIQKFASDAESAVVMDQKFISFWIYLG